MLHVCRLFRNHEKVQLKSNLKKLRQIITAKDIFIKDEFPFKEGIDGNVGFWRGS